MRHITIVAGGFLSIFGRQGVPGSLIGPTPMLSQVRGKKVKVSIYSELE